jgi:hypothetical protein
MVPLALDRHNWPYWCLTDALSLMKIYVMKWIIPAASKGGRKVGQQGKRAARVSTNRNQGC